MTQQTGHAGARDHAEPNYMGVFLALFVLTMFEIGVIFTPFAQVFIRIMLVLLAFTKATLVAAYFMHLKFENRTLAFIAATPIVLCIGLMIALLPDSNPAKVKAPPPPAATAQTATTS